MSGRKTRSGNEFSPFTLGPPVRVTTDFDIAHALQALNDKQIADEDQGIESEDEYEVEQPEPSSPSSSTEASTSSSPGPTLRPHPPLHTTVSESRHKRTRKQQHVKDSRARKRAEKQAQQSLELRSLKAVALKRRQGLKSVLAEVVVEQLGVASSGWVGTRLANDKSTNAIEEVTQAPYNLHHIQWDGITPRPIVDKSDRVIAALAGQPSDPTWSNVESDASEAIRHAGKGASFNKKQAEHRRGPFPALAVGVSFGGGQKVPGNLLNSTINAAILASLLSNIAIKRFAGFAATAFNLFAPRLFAYYTAELGKLFSSNSGLRRNFSKGPWPAATINFGPFTVTFSHTDPGNLAFGWCSITSLGPFDPRRGGHLILWDLGLVIDFPPGSTILIPSAVIRHSNTCIQPGESRYSFTQYAAGGLFRWVKNGFCTDKTFTARATKEQLRQRERDRRQRWSDGLGLFSKLSEFEPKVLDTADT